MKKLMTIITIAVLVMVMMTGCTQEVTVLTVGSDEVTTGEATFVLRELEAMYEQQYGPEIWSQGFEGQTFDQIAKEGALDSITRLYIAKNVAADNGVELTDEEMAEIDTLMEQYLAVNSEETLKEDGITLDDVKAIFILNALGEKLMDEMLVDFVVDQTILDQALANDMTYQQIEKFGVEGVLEQVTAQHVLISTIAEDGTEFTEEQKAQALVTAEEVLQKAKDGVDFDGLVADYSGDPGWINNGGVYTFYRGEMVSEFEEAAFSMEIGDIVMVESQFGYHIIRKQDHTYPDEAQVKNVEDYKAYLVEQYAMTQKQGEYDKLYEEWKVNYEVVPNEEAWAAVKTGYEKVQDNVQSTTSAE